MKAQILEIQKERRKLEEEIENLNQQLQVFYDKGFNKSLIDDEGFPRQDLDFGELTLYKNLKRQFNEKNNDYKDIMKKLEQSLFNMHEEMQKNPDVEKEIEIYTKKWKEEQKQKQIQQSQQIEIEVQSNEQAQTLQMNSQQFNQNNEIEVRPFAQLEDVIQGSPADKAGFKINDYLIRFGIIDHTNNNRLTNLFNYIKNQQNKKTQVKILRLLDPSQKIINLDFSQTSFIILDLEITPQVWNGNGLLGWKMVIV